MCYIVFQNKGVGKRAQTKGICWKYITRRTQCNTHFITTQMQGNARGLGGGSENFQATSFCQYKDQCIVELGDVLNSTAKLKYGALSHIITARILDSHPSEEQLRNLIDNPENFDKLCAHIAEEVGAARAGAGTNPQTDGAALPKLPRSNSWSDLLLYERDGKIFF